jgi:hypothetical protein
MKSKMMLATLVLGSALASSAFAETGQTHVTVFSHVGSAAARIEGKAAQALYDMLDVPAEKKGPEGHGVTTYTKQGKQIVCSGEFSNSQSSSTPEALAYSCRFLIMTDGEIETDGEVHPANGNL